MVFQNRDIAPLPKRSYILSPWGPIIRCTYGGWLLRGLIFFKGAPLNPKSTRTTLVGGWTNPIENISQNGSFSQVGLNIKNIWKPPPSTIFPSWKIGNLILPRSRQIHGRHFSPATTHWHLGVEIPMGWGFRMGRCLHQPKFKGSWNEKIYVFKIYIYIVSCGW